MPWHTTLWRKCHIWTCVSVKCFVLIHQPEGMYLSMVCNKFTVFMVFSDLTISWLKLQNVSRKRRETYVDFLRFDTSEILTCAVLIIETEIDMQSFWLWMLILWLCMVFHVKINKKEIKLISLNVFRETWLEGTFIVWFFYIWDNQWCIQGGGTMVWPPPPFGLAVNFCTVFVSFISP